MNSTANVIFVLALAAWASPASSAHAAFPGANGKIAFTSNRDGNDEIYVMNADGSGQTNLTNHSGSDSYPAWSPAGDKIAFVSNRHGNDDIYVMNADGSAVTRLTNNFIVDRFPAWSPDGTRLAFAAVTGSTWQVFAMDATDANADGNGDNQYQVTSAGGSNLSPAWSPDGSKIAFTSDRGGFSDIWVINANGSGETRLTLASGYQDVAPTWSPDGTRIAFGSSRNGAFDIYTLDYPSLAVTRLTTTSGAYPVGANEPAWSPDGTRIAFHFYDGTGASIYVMDADGSGQANLTAPSTTVLNVYPDWGAATTTIVNIDIKPGSFPNSINLRSAGVVPVAILSSATFDALEVNPGTVTLAGASVKRIGKGDKYSCAAEDVNDDGRPDLVCHVITAQFTIGPGDGIAVLEGATFAGRPIRGQDSIRIVRE